MEALKRVARRVLRRRREREANERKIATQQQKLRAMRRENLVMRRNLSHLGRHRYGSLTAGVAAWEAKWDASPGRRILLYATKDYSGSLLKWAHAINDHTDFAARMVVLVAHQYGYETDLIVLPPHLGGPGLDELAREADLVHLKDETGFLDDEEGLQPDFFTELGKPVVFTQYGGFARKHRDDDRYQALLRRTDACVSMTPDLCFPWLDSTYIPHSVDLDQYPYSWQDGLIVGHSPSIRGRKGTEDLLVAVEDLRAERPVELELIEGVSHAECLQRKRKTNVFFDQAGREMVEKLGIDAVIGWYGNSALEAAAYGIPTIAHLSAEAFEGARRAGLDIEEDCAIINTPLGVDGIRDTLAWYFALPAEDRAELSRRTRRWIETFHSQEAVGAQLAELYDGLLTGRSG